MWIHHKENPTVQDLRSIVPNVDMPLFNRSVLPMPNTVELSTPFRKRSTIDLTRFSTERFRRVPTERIVRPLPSHLLK